MLKKINCFLLCAILNFNIISSCNIVTAQNNTNQELNWYYLKQKNAPPKGAPESVDFLNKYNAFYIGDPNKKVLYLTFDEGYENGNTMAILDTLKKHNVKAAFFVVKPYIDKNGDIVKRMVEEGHLVCNHSNTHPSMPKITDKNAFIKEFKDTEESYYKLTSKEMPKFFRPPMGKYSENSLKETSNLGYKSIFWSFAYKDWLVNEQPTKEFALKTIKENAFNGTILLLHAVSNTNKDILDTLLKDLLNEGYTFESLETL